MRKFEERNEALYETTNHDVMQVPCDTRRRMNRSKMCGEWMRVRRKVAILNKHVASHNHTVTDDEQKNHITCRRMC